MVSGIVFDIKKYSIHDGPGIRTTVFFKGCPLHCGWCHNPESQSPAVEMIYRESRCIRCGACVEACEHGALSWHDRPVLDREKCERCGACAEVCYAEARQKIGREMTVPQVMAEIEQDVAFYDESGGGVTLSGGEPLLQREFAITLLQACKGQDIHTALDTCGFAAPETLERVHEHVDLFLYDLKLIDDARHRKFTGLSNGIVLENLRRLSEAGQNLIVRIPIIPGVNDDEENLRQTGIFLASLPTPPPVELLAYHNLAAAKYAGLGMEYGLEEIRPPSREQVSEVAGLLGLYGLRVKA